MHPVCAFLESRGPSELIGQCVLVDSPQEPRTKKKRGSSWDPVGLRPGGALMAGQGRVDTLGRGARNRESRAGLLSTFGKQNRIEKNEKCLSFSGPAALMSECVWTRFGTAPGLAGRGS